MIAINTIMKPLAAGTMVILTAMATESAFAQRSVANDAVGGAAKGAVIGAIAGDAGKGAAAGAVGGALFGGMTRRPGRGTTPTEDLLGGGGGRDHRRYRR